MHAGKLYLMDWIEAMKEGMANAMPFAEGLSSGFAEGLGSKKPLF